MFAYIILKKNNTYTLLSLLYILMDNIGHHLQRVNLCSSKLLYHCEACNKRRKNTILKGNLTDLLITMIQQNAKNRKIECVTNFGYLLLSMSGYNQSLISLLTPKRTTLQFGDKRIIFTNLLFVHKLAKPFAPH